MCHILRSVISTTKTRTWNVFEISCQKCRKTKTSSLQIHEKSFSTFFGHLLWQQRGRSESLMVLSRRNDNKCCNFSLRFLHRIPALAVSLLLCARQSSRWLAKLRVFRRHRKQAEEERQKRLGIKRQVSQCHGGVRWLYRDVVYFPLYMSNLCQLHGFARYV